VVLLVYGGGIASGVADIVARPSGGRIAWNLLGVIAASFVAWVVWRDVNKRRARGLPLGSISMLRQDLAVFRDHDLRGRITGEFLAADEMLVRTAFAVSRLPGRRPVFLSLTDKRLIVQRLSPWTMDAMGLLFAEPLNRVSVVEFKRRLWPGSSVWIRRADGETVRFIFPNLPPRRRREAEELVAGLAGSEPER
jgi:hypothetical protein